MKFLVSQFIPTPSIIVSYGCFTRYVYAYLLEYSTPNFTRLYRLEPGGSTKYILILLLHFLRYFEMPAIEPPVPIIMMGKLEITCPTHKCINFSFHLIPNLWPCLFIMNLKIWLVLELVGKYWTFILIGKVLCMSYVIILSIYYAAWSFLYQICPKYLEKLLLLERLIIWNNNAGLVASF